MENQLTLSEVKKLSKNELKNFISQLEIAMKDLLNLNSDKASKLNLFIGKVIDIYNSK